jgi:hypothetical protein
MQVPPQIWTCQPQHKMPQEDHAATSADNKTIDDDDATVIRIVRSDDSQSLYNAVENDESVVLKDGNPTLPASSSGLIHVPSALAINSEWETSSSSSIHECEVIAPKPLHCGDDVSALGWQLQSRCALRT